MKLHLLAMAGALLSGASVATSDGYNFRNATANDHFDWPKELFHLDPSKFIDVKIDLPYIDDDVDDQASKPDHRAVYYVDLNGDGKKEIIVVLGRDGQQEDFGIFQMREGKWVSIGMFYNGCSFCSKWNGYYQLEDSGNGGGGVRSRRLLRFVRGQYREVRDEIYDRDVLNQLRVNPNGLDN